MNNETQKYFILGIIAILIIVLAILFIVRYTVFKTGKYLTKLPESELIKQGYGVYSTAFSTGCLTATGKCVTSGVKYTTQYCVPNKNTGKGCLNQEGQLTFASQTISENCLPNCRSFTLAQQNTPGKFSSSDYRFCNYPVPYNSSDYSCVPRSVRPYYYNILNCNINDIVGDNSCTYVCGADGIGPNGISGDSDPSLPSYIPNCVNRKGNVITLNSFNYDLIGNIPNNGFQISKGYTITNYIPSGATVASLLEFNISPPYIPAPTDSNLSPTGTSVINLEDLRTLDNQLVVLENCILESKKPYCGSLYAYTPIEIGGNTTLSDKKTAPLANGTIVQTPACYVDPYWNTGDYINPFKGNTGPIALYKLESGIGQFGITFEYEACEQVNSKLAGVTGTNPQQYYLPPPFTKGNRCLPLIGLTGSAAGPSSTTCYSNINDIPLQLIEGQNYTICETVFPNGNKPQGLSNVPGLAVNCQYIPENQSIDFSTFVQLNPKLKQLIGNNVQINAKDPSTGKSYFLSIKTSPCSSGINSDNLIPLTNCSTLSSDLSQGYQQQECLFVYDGGNETLGSAGAGIYWDKLNCDDEMISLTSSLTLVISPRGPILDANSIDCDIYAYFGNTYGQLYPSGGSLLYYPLKTSEIFIKSSYQSPNSFQIKYNTSTNDYEIYDDSGNAISVEYYDGITFSTTNTFNISNSSLEITPRIYPFNGNIIKQGGIYPGKNITSAVTNQRDNPCYYNNCDPDAVDPDDPNASCFPDTCNLYYKYNSNIC